MGSGSEWLRNAMLKAGVVQHRPVELKGGESSDVYFDVKRAYGEQILMMGAAQELGRDIPRGVVVVGSGHGGVPLAAALCTYGGYRASYVREAPKGHGLPDLIDGSRLSPGDEAFIVDDVLTTGGSILRVARVLREQGAVVTGAGVIVRRNSADIGLRVYSLFDAADLLRSAQP